MIKRLCVPAAAILFLVDQSSSSARNYSQLVDRLTAQIQDTACTLDVNREETQLATPLSAQSRHIPKKPGLILDYLLSIKCSTGNVTDKIDYQERVFDSPIAAFRLSDEGPNMITIWASGSAYRVKIYSLIAGKLNKSFDFPTKSFPQFGFNSNGGLVVVLDDEDNQSSAHFTFSGSIWEWTGGKFLKSH